MQRAASNCAKYWEQFDPLLCTAAGAERLLIGNHWPLEVLASIIASVSSRAELRLIRRCRRDVSRSPRAGCSSAGRAASLPVTNQPQVASMRMSSASTRPGLAWRGWGGSAWVVSSLPEHVRASTLHITRCLRVPCNLQSSLCVNHRRFTGQSRLFCSLSKHQHCLLLKAPCRFYISNLFVSRVNVTQLA